jgi:hypothetical protein
LHHKIGHDGVDFPSQFDKPDGKIIFPGLPGQIKGIDRDAVAPYPRPGIKKA